MSSNNKPVVGGADHSQMGKAADMRNNFPKGSETRQELNKIVHLENPANAAKYGHAGVYNSAAEKVLQSAAAKGKK